MATPGYFGALGIPLVAGRDFAPGDTNEADPVVVINEALARRYWQAPRDAVGARVNMFGEDRTIVGVFGDVRDTPWADKAAPAYYFPQAQESFGDMMLVLDAAVNPQSLVQPVLAAVHEIDPALPLGEIAPLTRLAGEAFALRRSLVVLVTTFGATSLFLSIIGVYGVMAQTVGQRTREFGVRLALGATPGEILRLVLTSAAAISGAGAVSGVVLAAASTRLLGSALFGVSPVDPAIFVVVAVLLLASALGASYLPARRAARLDPAISLRSE
jgi:putative ABC transport system permease protein